jgi:SAM-dependent methyltransferase
MSKEPSTRDCVACGSQAAKPLYRDLVTCSDCGLIYFPRRLTADEEHSLYAETYFGGAEYFDYLADRRAHEANFRRRVRQLQRLIPAGSRVFEIGSSYGLFLNLARRHWQVRGCDISDEPCRFAGGELKLDVQCGDFLQIDLSPGAVDAICLWDTVEHIDDLGGYMERIAEVLPVGGVLALTTGDIGSWLAQRQGPLWRQIHPPTHLWYFSVPTMTRMLNRFGFDVVDCRHVGMWRSTASILHGLTSVGRPPSWPLRIAQRLGLDQLNFWLNTFDLMFVVGRRRSAAADSTVRARPVAA